MINPYQPPETIVQPLNHDALRESIRLRLSRPATALLVMSSIHSVFPAIGLVSFVFVVLFGSPVGPDSIPVLIVLSLHFIAQITISIGAAKMGQLESFRAAKISAIMSCIPGISPFMLFGIPFGIWSLRLLAIPEVRAAFPDVSKGNPPIRHESQAKG
ncbi:hypothetical protein SH449x_002450 [Pirellulaceae bacterium SH449]